MSIREPFNEDTSMPGGGTPPPPTDALIIGVAVGCVCAFLLAIVVVYSCIRRAKLKKKMKQFEVAAAVPQLVIERAADEQTSSVPSGSRVIPGSRHPDGTESEYGSVRGSPPPSPTPSWKSAISTFSISRSRPGSFDTCYSLSSSYGSARSYVSRKSRATLASFKSARSDVDD